jgi:O-antigen biosynthesis protein
LKYIDKSKVTVVVSEVETNEIRKYDQKATIVRISNIHADLDDELTPKPYEQRTGCVFVGNWNHLPNRDAVLWFTKSILPQVWGGGVIG